jgi:hypothetical protein
MGIPPLPPLPQGPGAVGPVGGGVMTPPMGTQFRPQPAADVTNGLADFVKNFVGMKTQAQQMYQDKFWNMLKMKQAGIPIDDEEAAKYAKKGGLPVRTEPWTDEEQAWMKAQPAAQASNAAINMQSAAGYPNPQAPPGLAATAAPGQGPQPAPPPMAQPQGFWNNLKQAIMGPNVPPGAGGPGTPMGNFMQSVGQAAQGAGATIPGQIATAGQFQNVALQDKKAEAGLKTIGVGNAQQLKGLVDQALNGDTNAIDMLGRSGAWKDRQMDDDLRLMQQLYPGDPNVRQKAAELHFYLAMGGPQVRLAMRKEGSAMAGRFGGDPMKGIQYFNDLYRTGQSQLVPS